jgi:hypothetical protein
MECILSGPTYIGENRTTLGKAYEIKGWWDWEHLGEHIENLRNLLRTWWEHLGISTKTKIPTTNPHPSNKKTGLLGLLLHWIIGWAKFLFLNVLFTIFGLG